jgi:hypothetical protein
MKMPRALPGVTHKNPTRPGCTKEEKCSNPRCKYDIHNPEQLKLEHEELHVPRGQILRSCRARDISSQNPGS